MEALRLLAAAIALAAVTVVVTSARQPDGLPYSQLDRPVPAQPNQPAGGPAGGAGMPASPEPASAPRRPPRTRLA